MRGGLGLGVVEEIPPLLTYLMVPLQALTEYAVLPLGSQYIHERAPYVKSILLYGAEKTGKTLLTHVSV